MFPVNAADVLLVISISLLTSGGIKPFVYNECVLHVLVKQMGNS